MPLLLHIFVNLHKNIMPELKSIKELIAEAKSGEENGQPEQAAELYEQALQQDKLNEYAANRLMIIYSKLKDQKKELQIIDTAIKAYEKFYASKKHTNKSIAAISDKLNKSFGLADKKGNALYTPEPIATWQKRKELLEKRKKK
jgi:tetratricopeptide (TPR) repeat protein